VSKTDNLLRSLYRCIRRTAAVPAVAAILVGTSSGVLPVHAQHQDKTTEDIIKNVVECPIPDSSPAKLRKRWAEDKKGLFDESKKLEGYINTNPFKGCERIDPKSKRAVNCQKKQDDLVLRIKNLNSEIDKFCNLMKTAATCATGGRTMDEAGPKNYTCRLIVPRQYNLACVETAIRGSRLESTSPGVCTLGSKPSRDNPKTCFNCGEAYLMQLESALQNPAQMRTAGADRNTQSALEQSNAAYASCWAQVEAASREDCSRTCAGRLFAQIVPVGTSRGCLPAP
jgi:hypothetical protein